jgi:hypothetical protein
MIVWWKIETVQFSFNEKKFCFLGKILTEKLPTEKYLDETLSPRKPTISSCTNVIFAYSRFKFISETLVLLPKKNISIET